MLTSREVARAEEAVSHSPHAACAVIQSVARGLSPSAQQAATISPRQLTSGSKFPRSNGRLPHIALGKESSSGLLLIRQFRERLISSTDLSSGMNIVFGVSGYLALFVYECPTPFICDEIEYATPECWKIHQSDRSQIATLMTEGGRRCSQLLYAHRLAFVCE